MIHYQLNYQLRVSVIVFINLNISLVKGKMKDNRELVDIIDFSGGLVTNAAVTSLEPKFTPDCINVYAEGSLLRKRAGYTNINSSTVAAGSRCNGIFNWVKSVSDQLLMAVFGGVLYKMDLSGSSWDGTFDAISAHATSGTPLTDSIVHFATYSWTLIFTTEDRINPQKMLATDTSHFNIESGGSGIAPRGKYIQVWKEHVWILNISAGGALTEEFDSVANWTDNDVGGGASTQATTTGLGTLKMVGVSGASASHAIRTQDIGTLSSDYVIELKANFDVLQSVGATSTSTGYGLIHFDNGLTRLSTRWSLDGLEVFNGADYYEVGVDVLPVDTWNTWKFVVTGGTATAATLDVLKDGIYVGVGLDMTSAAADTASNGQIQFTAQAGTGSGATYYVDYVYVNPSSPQIEYFTDKTFSAWDSASVPTSPNLIAQPVQPLVHFKLNDDAANTTVTDSGTGANNGTSSVNTSDLSVAGKINDAFDFTPGEIVNISGIVSTIKDDTVGSIS